MTIGNENIVKSTSSASSSEFPETPSLPPLSLVDRFVSPLLSAAFDGARKVTQDADAIAIYIINVTDEIIVSFEFLKMFFKKNSGNSFKTPSNTSPKNITQ